MLSDYIYRKKAVISARVVSCSVKAWHSCFLLHIPQVYMVFLIFIFLKAAPNT